MEFIESNHKKMSVTDIARTLERSIPSIKNYIEKKIGDGKTLETKQLRAEYDITSRPYWKEIERQFNKDEIPLFIFHWEKTISQFKDDVLPTEELQIVEMIKMEILMNRMLKKQKQTSDDIADIEDKIRKEQLKPTASRDMPMLGLLGQQLSMFYQAHQAASKEFQDMSSRKLKILENLKATRNQRYAKIENSRQTFLGFLTSILSDKEKRKEWGILIEKRRQAAEQEMKRLGEYHTYIDGTVDQPLLTPESVKNDNVIQ